MGRRSGGNKAMSGRREKDSKRASPFLVSIELVKAMITKKTSLAHVLSVIESKRKTEGKEVTDARG